MNKARMPSSNKTGLVLKISIVLFILLALVVYKLNDYFKNEKQYLTEAQLRNKVVQVKTTVSSQLSQLKNILSSYETELADSNINWVQLDPFFAIARLEKTGRTLKVSRLLVRSNTPAERWNSAYFEKALSISKSTHKGPILAQLFRDKSGAKYLIVRFRINQNKELAVVGAADYFQKFFDNERAQTSTALLATTENTLAAHSEGDYIATQTQETKFNRKKYLLEKEEIIGTNLIAMNYILKKKISGGLMVPWSIIGVIAGFGCILIAILFYSLDPIERRVERYKKQERAQIYKDTVGSLVSKTALINLENTAPPIASVTSDPPVISAPKAAEVVPAIEKKLSPPKDFYSIVKTVEEANMMTPNIRFEDEATKTTTIENILDEEQTNAIEAPDQFLSIEEDKIDLSDIEKALALDDFDSEELTAASSDMLKENLTSKKISVSSLGAPIDKPHFVLETKDFRVNEFKVNIRRPEKT